MQGKRYQQTDIMDNKSHIKTTDSPIDRKKVIKGEYNRTRHFKL